LGDVQAVCGKLIRNGAQGARLLAELRVELRRRHPLVISRRTRRMQLGQIRIGRGAVAQRKINRELHGLTCGCSGTHDRPFGGKGAAREREA